MPNQGHDKRTFRMAKKPWEEFVATCEAAGLSPQDVLRNLVLWYSRAPRVTVKRPPKSDPPEQSG